MLCNTFVAMQIHTCIVICALQNAMCRVPSQDRYGISHGYVDCTLVASKLELRHLSCLININRATYTTYIRMTKKKDKMKEKKFIVIYVCERVTLTHTNIEKKNTSRHSKWLSSQQSPRNNHCTFVIHLLLRDVRMPKANDFLFFFCSFRCRQFIQFQSYDLIQVAGLGKNSMPAKVYKTRTRYGQRFLQMIFLQ